VLPATVADACCGADYEPARRLTFRSRAGKDVARSYLSSPLEFNKTPDMPMAPARGPQHNRIPARPSLAPMAANLVRESRTES
jgi:hypothetical protein